MICLGSGAPPEMAFRILREDTAFSAPRQRQKRQKVENHLRAIRSLSCLTCGRRPAEAAHIRAAAPQYLKRETGAGEKPSDMWTLPLCPTCHRTGDDAQHSIGELGFYSLHGIDPFLTALTLWMNSPDEAAMELVVREARNRPPERRA